MDSRKKYQIQGKAAHPHVGKMLASYIYSRHITLTSIAEQMGVASSGIGHYLDRESLQLGILWKLGIALEHDFISEIAQKHPNRIATPRELELEAELLDLKKELEIYKRIVGK